MKTTLYVSGMIGTFISTLSAADSIDRSAAYAPIPGSINRLAYELPRALQPFVCHENIPGISNNVLLQLTQAQYVAHCSVIAGLSHVSFIIIEEPDLTQSTQESQASIASTVVVILSQNSQESLPATVPTIVIEES